MLIFTVDHHMALLLGMQHFLLEIYFILSFKNQACLRNLQKGSFPCYRAFSVEECSSRKLLRLINYVNTLTFNKIKYALKTYEQLVVLTSNVHFFVGDVLY